MEEFQIFIHALALLAPLFSASTCAIVVGFSRNNCFTPEEKKLKNILLTYLLFNSSVWITLFFFTFVPEVFFYLSIICLISNIFGPIFYYRTLCTLVSIDRLKCFSPLHYIAPALIAVGGLIWVYILGNQLITGAIFVVRASFALAYFTIFTLHLIHFYRWSLHTRNLIRKPAYWVGLLIILSLFPLYMSMVVLVQRPDAFLAGIWGGFAALGIFVSNIMLTYHVCRRRYLFYSKVFSESSPEHGEETLISDKPGRRNYSGTLTRERLEEWFRVKKPYLKQDFKITDIMKEMDVNRTIASSFINKTYGMNFNRFVNRWRIKEYERLLSLYGSEKESEYKLYIQAGFNELRQYHRAVEAELRAKKS